MGATCSSGKSEVLEFEADAEKAVKFEVDFSRPLSVVIFGATGDLARKKLYPALFQLLYGCPDAPLLPRNVKIIGYGRGKEDLQAFLKKQCVNCKGDKAQLDEFMSKCVYFQGQYDKPEDFGRLDGEMTLAGADCNRLFFLSVPPVIFGTVVENIKAKASARGGGWTRLLVEKPFGRDTPTFNELNATTSRCFTEEQLYRIDHYLGKEVVLNLMALRFANQVWEPVWNKDHIASVQITFKEDLGLGGRGGYFDTFGIIRDIMQNHLLQVLSWVAMEPPGRMDPEIITRNKVNVLKAMRTLNVDDVFVGQFVANSWRFGKDTFDEPGYLDDPSVPNDSVCPTFASALLQIDNDRWRGVPFLMTAGKGLSERMCEVRITFKHQQYNKLFMKRDTALANRNELVLRIQPEEAIYLKSQNKRPGWDVTNFSTATLDMSYSASFADSYVADAYERMFLNAAKGDGTLFVHANEIAEAWRVFTPLLNKLDVLKRKPHPYKFGVPIPPGWLEWAQAKAQVTEPNTLEAFLALHGGKISDMERIFNDLDKNKDGMLEKDELQVMMSKFYDGRVPTHAQIARALQRFDLDGDGRVSWEEFKQGASALHVTCVDPTKVDHT